MKVRAVRLVSVVGWMDFTRGSKHTRELIELHNVFVREGLSLQREGRRVLLWLVAEIFNVALRVRDEARWGSIVFISVF